MGRRPNYRAKIGELLKSGETRGGTLRTEILAVNGENELAARRFEKVLRLLDALKSVGMEEYPGFCAKISRATGYSRSRVSDILSGKAPLNSRFVATVCATFGTNEEFISEGTGAMSAEGTPEQRNHVEDRAIREAVALLESMSKPDRWRAVAVLKEIRGICNRNTAH
ncbi:MAG TPA: hypothetical protein PK036_17055 [Geobacteraceae bacterium]|nr:hypothetical protein [Geobacteraceae bacterium]